LHRVELGFADLSGLPLPADATESWRTRAVHERTDLRRLLADYAAAEAAVKLEVARQFPEISVKPGYLWDQGDRRWSLALGWLIPPTLGNQPAIREAEARRQEVAQRFMARQAAVVGEIDAAALRCDRLGQAATLGEQALQLAIEAETRQDRGFAAGAIDRVELAASRLERLAAQRANLVRKVALLQAQADLMAALQAPPFEATARVAQFAGADWEGSRR
jgi:outer membrane protein TolC